jgi:MYXO-CTERM domain-containing protein
MLWGLWGCGGGGHAVIYQPVDDDDWLDELASRVLLTGGREDLSGALDGPHVTGGSLRLVATRRRDPPTAWTAETLEPEIAEVGSALATDDGIELELWFHRQGTTELFLLDGSGTVIDVQRLTVRDPVGLELLSWDDLAAGGGGPLPDPVHLVPGSRSTLAVSWVDSSGAALLGGGLVQIEGSSATPGVSVRHTFDGQADLLDLDIELTAPSGVFPVEISAPTASLSRRIEIHDRDKVDEVKLVERTFDDDTASGTLIAEVYVGGDRMVGAPVLFTSPFDEAQEGTVVEWRQEDSVPTPITACFDGVCDTLEIPGRIVSISDGFSEPPACGCRSTAGTSPAWLLGLLGLAGVAARGRRYSRTMAL